MPPILDMTFDASTLPALRAAVRARALRAGFPENRAEHVVLAVHELAANSVRHGGGAGRLRVWNLARSLECQVDDGELRGTAGSGGGHAGPGSASGRMSMNSLPSVPGHGLWVVRQVADQMRSMSGPRGTSVVATFGPHD
jgi:anti-sigma regulatory factor (Ser/Thr protein kinase)